jgi:HEAT repeat protein
MLRMLRALAALVLLTGQDDDVRARIPEILQRLSQDDVVSRSAARRDLFALPLRFVPDVIAAGAKVEDAEQRAVLSEVRALAPWATLLAGTIGEARATLLKLQDRRDPAWTASLKRFLGGLSGRPPAQVVPALEALLASPHEGTRCLALAGLVRFPPPRAAPFLPLLRDPAVADEAAEVIVATGDLSVVPAVLELFLAGKEGSSAAAAILNELGPGDAVDRLLAAAKRDENLADDALEILARAGPAAEPALLELFGVEHVDKDDLILALRKVGGPASIPAVRKYYETEDDPDERDESLFLLGDSQWPLERLAQARKDPGILPDLYPLRLASRGGPALRDPLVDWLREPRVKVSVRNALFPILGAAAREEDLPLFVAALKDPRLREMAAEALDLIGSPAPAAAVMDAFKRSRDPERLHRVLLGMPAETLEEDLLEVLADPDGYSDDRHRMTAVTLAARRPTPRLKDALLARLTDPRTARDESAGAAIELLCSRMGKDDLPRLAPLRVHAEARVRAAGHLLALRAGDLAAAPALAALLPDGRATISTPAGSLDFLALGAPAGRPWTDAVLAEWRRKPDWNEAACWLATRDVREVHPRLRALLSLRTERERLPAEWALASTGDPEALERITLRILSRQLNTQPDGDAEVLAAAAGRERRARILAAARAPSGRGSNEHVLRTAARMAIPEGVPLYRAAFRADQSDEDWEEDEDEVTFRCIDAVVKLRATEAIPDLRRLLRSRQPFNRARAALALAELGDRDAVRLLVPLIEDPFEARNGDNRDDDENFTPIRRVWHAALEALEKLGRTTFEGGSTAARRASARVWYEKNRGAYP